ncbi:MAG: TlpA family protein disulfide reductase [Thiothrix sp.]|nr:MAG: TlpA family protein disulfide reductase [Thiothrix sp.]
MKIVKWATIFSGLLMSAAVSAQTPNFSFQDIYGKQHQFNEYKGKWVIVNYWSPQCGPCLSEIPALKQVAAQYRNNVVVLGMDAGETPDAELRRFIRQKGINYTVVPTQDSTMFALGLIYGVPTTYVVSPQGKVVDTHMGAVTVEQIKGYFAKEPQKYSDRGESIEKPCNEGVC